MIKQRTRLARDDEPLSIEPPSENDGSSRFRVGAIAFVLAEVLLLAAIPLLAFLGGRALLNSRAGEFVETPTEADPGWLAFVEPTPVSFVAEVLDGQLTGAAIVMRSGADVTGGVVALVPGSLEVEGRALSERSPEDGANALASALELAIPDVMVADAAWWAEVVPDGLALTNPDPVPNDGGVIAVGDTVIDPALVPTYLGVALDDGGAEAHEFRRRLWWQTLLDTPIEGLGPGGDLMRAVQRGTWRVQAMPMTVDDGVLRLDPSAVELLIAEAVALPIGAGPGDRVQVRLLDRVGSNDVLDAARYFGRAGFEVVQVGNAEVFDGGSTEVVVPLDAPVEAVTALTELLGPGTLSSQPEDGAVTQLTVLLGTDFGAALGSGPDGESTD